MSSFKPTNIKLSGTYLSINQNIVINLEKDSYEKNKEEFTPVNRVLLKGKVVNSEKEPIANAGIEITRINNKTNEKMLLGVVFTQKDGAYAVSVEVNENYDYILDVYSPV